jgi:hypothetical protein
MRRLWLLVALLILVPVVLIPVKLSGDVGSLDWCALQPFWMPLLIVLLATTAAYLLPRLGNWHIRKSGRHE